MCVTLCGHRAPTGDKWLVARKGRPGSHLAELLPGTPGDRPSHFPIAAVLERRPSVSPPICGGRNSSVCLTQITGCLSLMAACQGGRLCVFSPFTTIQGTHRGDSFSQPRSGSQSFVNQRGATVLEHSCAWLPHHTTHTLSWLAILACLTERYDSTA